MKGNPLKDKLLTFDAMIFDMDGTLVDSMWMWREIDIEYLNRFGIPLPEDLQKKIEGMSLSETAVYFKEHFSIPDDLETIKSDWIHMASYKYRYEVPMKKGVFQLLTYCMEHGIKLGIATSNSMELVNCINQAHHLDQYFTCIITGGQIEKSKPAPDIYLTAAHKLKVNAEKCLVFEDIIPGIMAGKNAGMKVCAVADKYSEGDWESKKKLADFSLSSYEEIL